MTEDSEEDILTMSIDQITLTADSEKSVRLAVRYLRDYAKKKPAKYCVLERAHVSGYAMSLFYKGSDKEYKASLREYYSTSEWKRLREAAFARDNSQCRICGRKEYLEVHHISYENFGNETIDELTTLCKGCHALVHMLRGKW